MIHTSPDLIQFLLPVQTVSKGAEGESAIVSGFGSLCVMDAHNDIVSHPGEFDLSFLQGDARLLLEHNDDALIGKVLEASPAELRDEDTVWGVYRLEDGERIGEVSKDVLGDDPDLQFTQGLWVTASVDDPAAAARVRAGGLSAFSWRGFVGHAQKLVDKTTGFVGRMLREIELTEISLTESPANPLARVAVAKSIDATDTDALFAELIRMAESLTAAISELKEQQEKLLRDARRGYTDVNTGDEVSKDANSIFDSVFAQDGETVVNHFN